MFILLLYLLNSSVALPTRFEKTSPVRLLTDNNFNKITSLGFTPVTKPWFIMFYVPGCPSCGRLIPIWEDMARQYKDKVIISAVNW